MSRGVRFVPHVFAPDGGSMRFSLSTLAVFIALLLSTCLIAQQSQPAPEALSVVQKAIAAAGGQQSVLAIKDFTSTGTITYYFNAQEVSGPVEILGRGLDQVRMVAQMADGPHSIVLNHGAGSSADPVSSHKISTLNGFHLGLLILSVPSIVAAVNDPLGSFALEGTEQIGGTSAYKVKMIHGIPQHFDRIDVLKRIKASEIFIDSTNYMIVAIRHFYYPKETLARSIPREVDFSDFRQVKGVAVPFTIKEKVGSQPTWTINLSGIDFNVGVGEEIFRQ
jgi:hypothetical protein